MLLDPPCRMRVLPAAMFVHLCLRKLLVAEAAVHALRNQRVLLEAFRQKAGVTVPLLYLCCRMNPAATGCCWNVKQWNTPVSNKPIASVVSAKGGGMYATRRIVLLRHTVLSTGLHLCKVDCRRAFETTQTSGIHYYSQQTLQFHFR